ncbi:related to Epoxide hydrolase 1 [Melanopsichium pennsylvanicum]|uniref:Related to Epoxide hydrolase 1 n=2 Tax=Melanopsichium pennsylvanicum TaxID=63383 RepID=A0AAJ4XI12_9BASI|nr:related to Epoxide hydrolase 1 [Melanopsichium pennsylvanicum 4]SNX82895.1 related to Epoxide hydrolase 1 [Melanopsichium pennsylvanicum]
MSEVGKPRQIRLEFSDADLDRLQRKLDDARLPESEITGGIKPWEYGTELAKLRQILDDWKAGNPKDNHRQAVGSPHQGVKKWWRGVEDKLNKHAHYQVQIEGINVHYQHFKSSISDDKAGMPAIPLVFSHGWPGCFTEAYYFASKLVESRAPRFEVIVPSLPGYGLSSAPLQKGWTLQDSARVFDTLMTAVLGFKSYMAQGGDWGSLVTRFMANSPNCKIAHINFVPPSPPVWTYPVLALEGRGWSGLASRSLKLLGYHPQEVLGIERSMQYLSKGNGYAMIQATQPSTLGYGLYDNPVGILVWILEKYKTWSDPRCPAFNECNTDASSHSFITDQDILTTVMIYYLTNSIHTSFLPYRESMHLFDQPDWSVWAPAKQKPFGYSSFPFEIVSGPKSWLKRYGLNWQFFKMHDFGGHFAAL